MLDVITDFWKPVKKPGTQEKPDVDRLQVGSAITFANVPQALLSGRKFKVTAVNTYQFGDERMTSFVLAQDKEESVSMIIASADGEQYLAISRRIPFSDRMKLFDPSELEAVVEQADSVRLGTHEVDGNWKHWVVNTYKKEIAGLKGSVTRGDYRRQAMPANALSQAFDYLLLASDNNEYAVEIERYADGRLELFATVYRRITDIASVEHADAMEPPRIAATGAPVLEVVRPQPVELPPVLTPQQLQKAVEKPIEKAPEKADVKIEAKPEIKAEAKPVEFKPMFTPEPPASAVKAPIVEQAPPAAPAKDEPITPPPAPVAAAAPAPELPKPQPTETSMQMYPTSNGSNRDESVKPKTGNAGYAPTSQMEAKTVNTMEIENDAIDCELRVANKIIEEAIRNEMRLSDVVRRIIALPVSNPDSVQIPITLTDSDYHLLAIRYGISASDRNAIKARIIDEINTFSGNKKN